MSLHREIRKKAAQKQLRLSELGPNSLEIAQRMLKNGEIYTCPKGYLRLNEA